MINYKLVICGSERRFLELAGDGTELVKITSTSRGLSGWYIYLRGGEKNQFIRQGNEGLLDRIFCSTQYLQFDTNLGLLPNSFHENYSPVGPSVHLEEYNVGRKILEEVELWEDKGSK